MLVSNSTVILLPLPAGIKGIHHHHLAMSIIFNFYTRQNWEPFKKLKNLQPGMVARTFNSNTKEAEHIDLLSLRPAWLISRF